MSTPETRTRNMICSWLRLHMRRIGLAHFWISRNMGVYDPARKCYRKDPSPYSIKGIPDILGYYQSGRFFGIEVKTEAQKNLFGKGTSRGYASPEQKAFIEHAVLNGCDVFIARSLEDLEQHFFPKGAA